MNRSKKNAANGNAKREARAPPPGPRLLSRHEVVDIAGVTYPTIWKMMRSGEFPRSRICGGKSKWLSSEVEEWMKQLPKRQLKGDVPDDAREEGKETKEADRLWEGNPPTFHNQNRRQKGTTPQCE